MKKVLFVSGTFDDFKGKKSSLADILLESMNLSNVEYYNGGEYSSLVQIADNVKNYSLIFWFANIPNDKTKLAKRLKSVNQEMILVTSKRNIDKKYEFTDLVAHALNNRSNLCVEITKPSDKYAARIIDPLGNVFLDTCVDFKVVAKTLKKRVMELRGYTRVKSENIGPSLVSNEENFCNLVTSYATVFHKLIHPNEKTSRFMGNASFRCTYGFPSFRKDGLIFVSKRNIDKRTITSEDFVAIKPSEPIGYFGKFKPSVDTPVQSRLYGYYQNINYLLHSHVYVKNAPFTKRIIPCGAVEEVEDITEIFSDRTIMNFGINLKGHGSIVFANDLSGFINLDYVQRIFPEIHKDYAVN